MGNQKLLLENISEIQMGYQARGKVDENLDGNYTIVRPQDFNDMGELMLDQAMPFFPSDTDPSNYLISGGDILIQVRGQNHNAFLIHKPLESTVASNSFYIIRIKDRDRLLPAYLTWWINQRTVQIYFEKEQGLSTIPFISKSSLSKTPILIPPLNIQQKISDIESLWRQEQNLLQRFTQVKDNLIQAVAHKAIEQSKEV
jgi:restriction endonuclease S subunit